MTIDTQQLVNQQSKHSGQSTCALTLYLHELTYFKDLRRLVRAVVGGKELASAEQRVVDTVETARTSVLRTHLLVDDLHDELSVVGNIGFTLAAVTWITCLQAER